MSLTKTEIGRQALSSRNFSLSPKERQFMIMANGTRSRSALCELVGKSVDAEIDRLIELGFLVETRSPPLSKVEATPRVSKDTPKPMSKRSLAATKMYMMDMLQLLRDMDASAMAVSLHTSESEADFIANILSAVRLIALKSGTSYALRVLGKLTEIVPLPHLPLIEGLTCEMAVDVNVV
jgi:hypothetical protein